MDTAVATCPTGRRRSCCRAAAKPKISIRHLDFFYGKFQGLKDINLDIADRAT